MNGGRFIMVGFGAGILPGLDAVLPPGSLVVVEDPDVAAARQVRERMVPFACVAGLIESPIQREAVAEELARDWKVPADEVTAVLPGLEYGVVGAAALAEELGLPGAGLAAARLLRDKVALRAAADRAGLAQPAWQEVASAAEVRAFGHSSYVLKPANRQASVGVQLLDAGDDVEAAWQRTIAADEPFMRAPGGLLPRYLVEARMRGPEVSVEALVRDGEVIFANVTAKTVAPGRHPVELAHVLPAPLTPGLDEAVRTFVAATGFRTGTLHSEWILVDDRPHLVECAGRLPGDDIVPLIDLAYGGSLVADLAAVLSGRDPERPTAAARGAAVRFLTATPGVVLRIDGVPGARGSEGVVDVRVTVEPGDRVNRLISSWDRAGRVIATGQTGVTAAANAARAAAAISITTRDVAATTVTDPRAAAGWWQERPDDPRDGLAWAAGVADTNLFLGLPGGPALWLRPPGEPPTRMNAVDVVSGVVAATEPNRAAVEAARADHRAQLVCAATGYGSPLVHHGHPSFEDLETLIALFIAQARRHHATPAVLHCPASSPLLKALEVRGFAVGVTDLYPALELPGDGLDDYLAALPKARRANVRREIAARAGGRTEIHVGHAAREHLATAAELNASAYRQRGQAGDAERSLTVYSRLLDSCGDDFVLTLVHSGDRPVASACLVVGGTDLLLYSAGLELPWSRDVAGYFNAAYYLPIEFAYERGLRRILLGPTGWSTKRLRGARFSPLYSAVPAGATALVDLLARTDARLRESLERWRG